MSELVARLERVELARRSLAFLGLGQVGVAIRGPGGTLYVDPYLTDNDGSGGQMERLYPPPLRPEAVTNASAVLVTHAHIDHFDPQTLAGIGSASPEAVFAGPHTCDFGEASIRESRTIRPEALEGFEIGGARVTPVPSAHTELDWSEEGYPYLGYVVEWNDVVVYHAGDTVVYGEHPKSETPALIDILSNWSIDVMFVPINGRDYFRTEQGLKGNTNEREAVALAQELDVKLLIPTHYDLLAFNGANPAHFVDFLYRHHPNRPHHLLRPGEILSYTATY